MAQKNKFKVLLHFFRNKFVIASLFIFLWMLFFDQNSIIDRVSLYRSIRNMKQERENLINEINRNKEIINKLESGSDNLEKFAREEYMMIKPDEDLFIIIYETK
ncbi:MAG: septum formation initiator family protein [Marinilabiliaceae bacterium]|nr:septum formation initiator family protein [Marinilabiliaceae bacterium]